MVTTSPAYLIRMFGGILVSPDNLRDSFAAPPKSSLVGVTYTSIVRCSW